MRQLHTNEMRLFAQTVSGPFCTIVKNSMEAGMVFPSKLLANLEAAGYKIHVERGNKLVSLTITFNESEVPVTKAFAMASDEHEALLLAVYREMQEEAKHAA